MIHGTWSRYCHGCRCELCIAAGRRTAKAHRAAQRSAAPGYRGRGWRSPEPDLMTLDLVTAKVGPDFPALGTLLRTGWTEGA